MTNINLPEAGKGRWWKVALVKTRENNPIRVSLMESLVEGRKGLSTEIGFAHTVAVPEKVAEAADLVLVKVGGYDKVVGHYGEPTSHYPEITPAGEKRTDLAVGV